jgi:Protein of unknown function (DUF1810)
MSPLPSDKESDIEAVASLLAGFVRFVEARASMYLRVVVELTAGNERTRWMWFIFPPIAVSWALPCLGLVDVPCYDVETGHCATSTRSRSGPRTGSKWIASSMPPPRISLRTSGIPQPTL